MMRKLNKDSAETKTVFGLIDNAAGTIGLVLLVVALTVGLLTLVIARTSRTGTQFESNQPSSESVEVEFSAAPTVAFSQTSPKAEWKLYQNRQYQFSVQYPDEMNIDTMNFGPVLLKYAKIDRVFLLAGPTQEDAQELADGLLFAISVDENLSQLTLQEFVQQPLKEAEQYLEEVYGDIKKYQDIVPTATVTQIAGLDSVILSNHNVYGAKDIYFQNPTSKQIVILSYNSRGQSVLTYQKIADQMLQTFRFIE